MKSLWKKINHALLLTYLFCAIAPLALANPPVIAGLGSPQELLAKAIANRENLREVINLIKKNISSFQYPKQFEDYFSIMEPLQKIAQSQNPNIHEIYPDAVPELAAEMVNHGIRWVNAAKDSKERVISYHKWINKEERLEIAFRFLEVTSKAIRTTQDENALRTIATNLNALSAWAQNKFPSQAVLINGYQSSSTEIALRFLQKSSLSVNDKQYWIQQLAQPTAFDTYLDLLQREVYSIGDGNKDKSHSVFDLVIIAHKRLASIVKKEGGIFPIATANRFGALTQELVTHMIKLGVTFKYNEFEQALNIMQAAHIQNLANQWISMVNPSLNLYSTQYAALASALTKKLENAGLEKESRDLTTFITKISAPSITLQKDLEGVYQLMDSRGSQWVFTLAFAGKNHVIAALSDIGEAASEAFFYVGYDQASSEFSAYLRDPSSDPSQNPSLKFKINSGSITMQNRGQEFRGQKKSPFVNYLGSTSASNTALQAGTFSGTVYYPSFVESSGSPDTAIEMNLSLSLTTQGTFTGRMSSTNQPTSNFVDFQYSNKNNEGFLYLTSGAMEYTSWVQLRMRVIDNNTLSGYIIVGGRGISKQPFTLRRTAR